MYVIYIYIYSNINLKNKSGEEKNTRHLMYEINDFYLGMLNDLKNLKAQSKELQPQKESSRFPDIKPGVEPESPWKEDPTIQKQLSLISQLDKRIETTTNLLKAAEEERHVTEEEMCFLLSTTKTKGSELFLELASYGKKTQAEKEEEEGGRKEDVQSCRNKKKKEDHEGKDFIRRNIEVLVEP